MAGRDYRSFVLKSRSNPQGLLARLHSEPAENLLKLDDQDYILFESYRNKLKKHSEHDLNFMRQLKSNQRDFREIRLLKQHQATWTCEWARLNSMEKQILEELADLPVDWHTDLLHNEMDAVINLENEITETYKQFYETTITPLLTLRWDLHFWYQARKIKDNFGQGEPNAVFDVIKSVSEQQKVLMERLEYEVRELSNFQDSIGIKGLKSDAEVYQGIPTCVNFTHSPDHLTKSLVDEFIILDIKFQQKLLMVKERHSNFVRSRNGGWSDKEHAIFKHVMNLYSSHVANYQELMFDFLRKLLPRYSLDDLLLHQTWISSRRQYKEAVSAVLADWERCKNELAIKAQSIIFRAHRILKENAEKAVAYKRQKQLCYDLYIKIIQWRQWKLQKLLLDEEREAQHYAEEKRRADAADEERRAVIKEKLESYRKEQITAKEQQFQKMKLLALKSRKARMEQTLVNTERIKFRESQRIARLEQRKVFQSQIIKKGEDKQKRLEKLRLAVAIEANSDPYRIQQTTMSYDAKRKREYEDDPIPILKPLFEVYTFTDKKLAADSRLRLESKLREANLIHLPYAQEVLRQLPPPTNPRPDTNSTFRFDEQ